MSDRLVEIHINMQGRVIVRYEGGKCVDVTDTRGRKLYSAQAQAVNQQLLEAVGVVYAYGSELDGRHGRTFSWLKNPENIQDGTKLYTAPPATKIPEGWQIHAKVNAPADIKGQRIIGYRVTLPEGMFSEATDYLPSLTRPQPAVNQQLTLGDLNTIRQWHNAIKDAYVNYLEEQDAAVFEKIEAAIAAAQEQSK